MSEIAQHENRRKRLIYRSEHTGTQETDLLLGQFARTYVPGFSTEELDAFERLLETSDPDLWLWLTGRGEPPPDLETPVFARLRAFRYNLDDR
ncbi:MAG: succinate dehydrogenase assembly factor 2 [Alphaproteobacteria bacterium]